MADSKSAGRMAVWVRVPLRVQGRLGALTGSAVRPRAGLCCGERALFGCGCCQVPQGSSVLWGRAARVVSCVCVCLVSPFVGAVPFGVRLVRII